MSYNWSNGNTSPSITVTSDGQYFVTVTDANNQVSIDEITVTGVLEVEFEYDSPTCVSGNRTLTAVVSGGASPYTYLWSTESTQQSIQLCQDGTYEVTVTDANGCQISASKSTAIDYYIKQDDEIDQDLTWGSNIIITSSGQLTVTGTIRMAQDKHIIVNRGGKLIINGGTLTKCDEAPHWGGVIVKGNSEKAQPSHTANPGPDEAGIVVMKNNSLIEHAIAGISTNYFCQWTDEDWGGLVYCENSEFRKNRKAVAFMKYEFPNNSKFIDCTFDGAGAISSGTTNGVTIWDTDGVEFNQCRFYNLGHNGIVAYDAGAIVKDGNDFIGNGKAISCRATYPFSSFVEVGESNIEPNYFLDNWHHIENYASGKEQMLKIINNEFFTATNSALWNVGPTFFRFEDNVVTNSNGVYARNTAALGVNNHNYIENNGFTGPGTGIGADGLNRELQFLCNTFDNNAGDFVLIDQSSYPGEVRKFQGNHQEPAGNCFTRPVGISYGDINTIGNTTQFVYYHATLQNCEIPATPGNYFAVSLDEESCTDESENITPTTEEFNSILNDIQELDTAGKTDSVAYYNLLERKQEVLLYLLNHFIENDNIDSAIAILQQDGSTMAQLMHFGILMNEGAYTDAENYLNSVQNESPEWADFVQIQSINIERLQSEGEYQLSASDQSYLEDVAESNKGVKAYARSLLGLLEGIEYFDEWDLGGADAGLKLSTNNQVLKTEIIDVFPNPSKDIFTLTFEDGFNKKVKEVKIYNLVGELIYTKQDFETNKIEINAGNWTNGVYLLEVSIYGFQRKEIGKLIKQ